MMQQQRYSALVSVETAWVTKSLPIYTNFARFIAQNFSQSCLFVAFLLTRLQQFMYISVTYLLTYMSIFVTYLHKFWSICAHFITLIMEK